MLIVVIAHHTLGRISCTINIEGDTNSENGGFGKILLSDVSIDVAIDVSIDASLGFCTFLPISRENQLRNSTVRGGKVCYRECHKGSPYFVKIGCWRGSSSDY